MTKRLLWIGDLGIPSGFGKANFHVLSSLKAKHGWNVAGLGMGYKGDPHAWPFPIWCAGSKGNVWGFNRLDEMIDTTRPDVIGMQQDPWIVAEYQKHLGKVGWTGPVIAWIPVDGLNMRESTAEKLSELDAAVWYTRFGYDQAKLAGFTGPEHIIGMGVDLDNYRPIKPAELRKVFTIEGWNPDEDFIVGNLNANQTRKRQDLTVEWFAEWCRRERLPRNVKLLIYFGYEKHIGWDIPQLAKFHGCDDRMLFHDREDLLPEAHMPLLYNLLDVQVTTSDGEGWGLTTFEGMACGVPQVCGDFAALGEWATAAHRIPCPHSVGRTGWINTIGMLPCGGDFIQGLSWLYHSRKERRALRDAGLALVKEPAFRWEAVGDRFAEVLEGVNDGSEKDTDITGKTQRENEGIDGR